MEMNKNGGDVMAEYEIYALKVAGPFTGSGAFLMWLQDVHQRGWRDDSRGYGGVT
jgi:hypothetical protein